MVTRRFACYLLGLWAGCELMLALAALSAARPVPPTASNPGAVLLLRDAGPAGAALARFESGERTRRLLRDWGAAQIAFGGFYFLFLLLGTQEDKLTLATALGMLAAALLQAVWIAPEMSALGRLTDLNPAITRARMASVNGAYLVFGGLKCAAGGWLVFRLARRGPTPRVTLPSARARAARR